MYNNYPSDGSKKISTVTAVDINRAVCKCIADDGETLVDVRWVVPMGGSDGVGTSHHPVENSRVLVDFSSGFPFILGAILTESDSKVRRPNIGKQDLDEEQIADYTTIPAGKLIRGPGTPRDQRVGDIISTTDGGAIQGILSSGTVVNKASPLAQIICSRYGDLVRTVSRNYEHFTDVDETYKASIRGHVFGLQHVYRTPEESRNEVPSFTRMEGDVLAAELVGKTYAEYSSEDFPTVPADDGVVVKEYTAVEGDVTSSYIEDVEGSTRREIVGVDRELEGSGKSIQSEGSRQIRKRVEGGAKTNWWMNETDFHWDVNDGGTFINGNADGVVVNVEGKVVITCGSDGTLSVVNTGNTDINTSGTLNVKAKDTTFNLGATTFNCSGNFSVSAPVIALN